MELIRRITKEDLFARLESINGVLLFFSKTVLTFALSAHLVEDMTIHTIQNGGLNQFLVSQTFDSFLAV